MARTSKPSALIPPDAAIALLSFNAEAHLSAVLNDLRTQTRESFRLLIVDDASTDGAPDIGRAAAAEDDRITFHANPTRLGLAENSRYAYQLARELVPEARFFAWASDHDRWEPRWLEVLSDHLDAHPEALLVYPLVRRFTESEGTVRSPWRFETHGIRDPRARFLASARRLVAGDMIYGLFRAHAPGLAGTFPKVLLPDRILLTELAVHGEFHQVDQLLWHRRFEVMSTVRRQRKSSLQGCWYGRLPWPLQHIARLTRRLVFDGARPPELDRAAAGVLVASYAAIAHRIWLEQHVLGVIRSIRPAWLPARLRHLV